MKKRIDRMKMAGLMKKYCQGNYNKFARELSIDPAHLYRFLNTGVGGGKKMIFALMEFCEKHNLEFSQYFNMD